MSLRSRLIPVVLGVGLLVGVLLTAGRTTAAESNRPGLYGPAGGRNADALTYLYMHETTSLRANGDGEERIEFLVTNIGLTPVDSAEFRFEGDVTDFWGVEAWDEEGSLDHSIVIGVDTVTVTLYFREPVGLGEQYRYFFAINFPDVARESGGEWTLNWGTYFTVAEFVRTANLPGGAAVVYVDPAPTEQTADFVRWVRYAMLQFTFELRYTLRPLTDLELAQEFAPYFRMHNEEAYVPMRVSLALQYADCHDELNAPPQSCSLDLLGNDWLNNADSFIDFRGLPDGDLNEENSSHRYYVENILVAANADPVVYARVDRRVADRTVIQYWLYYYYNSWEKQTYLPIPWIHGVHEGDWEMVQVVLDGNHQPLYAAYAQHGELLEGLIKGGSKKEWNDLKPGRNISGSHPIVYPALGSHASYFGPGSYLLNFDVTAPESKGLLSPTPDVYLLDPDTADPWVGYLGKWGQPPGEDDEFQNGPVSPARQGIKWDDPLTWLEDWIDWDEFSAYQRGKIIARASSPCNVGLHNRTTDEIYGWVFNEFNNRIDGGEYVVNETLQVQSLILHDSYKETAEPYTLYSTCPEGVTPSARQTTEPPSLTVEFYDEASGELVTAQYDLPADWQPETTIASLALGDPAALALAVDRDNDGDTDAVVPPKSVVTGPIEEPGGTGDKLYIPVVLGN